MEAKRFDYSFWKKELAGLGYRLSESRIPTQFLRDKRAIPSGVSLKDARLIYQDPLGMDIVVLEYDRIPSRIGASRIARYWKEHQGGRQLLIFTDGNASYAIVIPGAIEKPDTKLKILSLSDRLYRTDTEALKSLKYTGDSKSLREQYDQNFLPYEKVRGEFFDGYRNLYRDTVKTVEPVLDANSNSYAQRFLGRLMFLYFLQRKGWLKQDKSFVDSIKDYGELNWIFYVGLSTEGNLGLPYLDGTLFEREEYLTPEKEEMINDGMNVIFNRARKLFDQYNFTVDELSPREVEVSLDPAMIGTIFENMLPENERGSKGTFYTPPEEISFICRRALSSYLRIQESVEKAEDNEMFKDGISALINKLNREKSEKEVRELRERVLSITVLDPSVGSGGFLLGMMQEMVDLLRQADESVGWNPDVDVYKSRILQNLFGFDIEDEAIEIARLRIWLSMIVDKKEAEPLQSLDLNILKISDSLVTLGGVQRKLGDELESTWVDMRNIREKFATAKKPDVRVKLRSELQKIQSDIEKKTGVKGGIIESWVPKQVDIIVMNPPYVRQESIPEDKKKYYTSNYKINKRSDLYCYFVLRALKLINQNGIVTVISSDKWLETGYGEDLQKMLSSRLVGIYGQRAKTFGADVNSIIFVYGSETDSSKKTDFVYLESYSSLLVRNNVQFVRKDLKTGKWFYLRAPKKFMEKVYPKLTHKLSDFADIRRGFTTDNNDFFLLKDISNLYNTDYLTNPEKFQERDILARNEKELRDEGLMYVENGFHEKFIIKKEDLLPALNDIQLLINRKIDDIQYFLFMPSPQLNKYSKKYIEWGENHTIIQKKGKNKGKEVKGINNLESVSKHKPNWYNIRLVKPSRVVVSRFVDKRYFVPISKDKDIFAGDSFALFYPRDNVSVELLWIYLNTNIFWIIEELYGRIGGGGVLAQIEGEYKKMQCPNLSDFKIDSHLIAKLLEMKAEDFNDERKTDTHYLLNKWLLDSIGLTDISVPELDSVLIDLMNERYYRANKKENNAKVGGEDEQDN